MMPKKKPTELLNENISNENLKKHMIAVSAIMQGLAKKFGENEEAWMLTGLLHDIDYEKVGGDMKRHGSVSAEMLQEMLPEGCLHAIKAHNESTGIKAESLLDKSLIAADAVSGLIVAAALVMPNKRLSEVMVETLKNKMKDKSFARNVDRNRIRVCEETGLELEEFFEMALRSMQGISNLLGL